MTTDASERSRPTGAQWTIRRGGDELVVVEFGGGIRGYTRGGVDVVAGYGPDEMSVAGRGQQLIPWPNRLRDGKYTHAGTERQLALTEPAKHNASHGLVRWTTWDLLDQTSTSITVGQRLHPQPGWAWVLELTTIYALADDGLTVTTTALNVGEGDAPYGYGAHPYLSIADTPVAEVALEIPAATYLETDPERQLPVGDPPGRGVRLRLPHQPADRRSRARHRLHRPRSRRRRPVGGHPERPRHRGGQPLGRRGVCVDAGVHGTGPPAYRGHDRHRGRADDLPAGRLQLRDRPRRPATRAVAYRLVGDPPGLSACENRVALPVRLVRRARDARP